MRAMSPSDLRVGAMFNPVDHVFAMSAKREVGQPVIGGIAVQMARHSTFRCGADKRLQH